MNAHDMQHGLTHVLHLLSAGDTQAAVKEVQGLRDLLDAPAVDYRGLLRTFQKEVQQALAAGIKRPPVWTFLGARQYFTVPMEEIHRLHYAMSLLSIVDVTDKTPAEVDEMAEKVMKLAQGEKEAEA